MKTEALTTHEYIRLEAFLLSERAGHPGNMDEIFWTQAEAIVHGRAAVVAGAGKSTKAKVKTVPTAKPAKKTLKAKAASKKAPLPPKIAAVAKPKAKPTAAKRKK